MLIFFFFTIVIIFLGIFIGSGDLKLLQLFFNLNDLFMVIGIVICSLISVWKIPDLIKAVQILFYKKRKISNKFLKIWNLIYISFFVSGLINFLINIILLIYNKKNIYVEYFCIPIIPLLYGIFFGFFAYIIKLKLENRKNRSKDIKSIEKKV